MDWLLLQSYQLMVQKAVEGAGEQLTEAEKNAVLSFARDGEQAVMALDVAVDMTRLFRTKYDRDLWTEVMDGYQIPRYMTGICGVISYTLFALNTNSAIPGVLGPIFDQVLELPLRLSSQIRKRETGLSTPTTQLPKRHWTTSSSVQILMGVGLIPS